MVNPEKIVWSCFILPIFFLKLYFLFGEQWRIYFTGEGILFYREFIAVLSQYI